MALQIMNYYNPSNKREKLDGVWGEIRRIYATMASPTMKDNLRGYALREKSLSKYEFINAVRTIYEAINYDGGETEVRQFYDALYIADDEHKNPPTPETPQTEYPYQCYTNYERYTIFAALWYVLSVCHPELDIVVNAVYRQAHFTDSQDRGLKPSAYYFEFFENALQKKQSSSEPDEEIDFNLNAILTENAERLNNGYKELPPHIRLRKFREILWSIQRMPAKEQQSPKIVLLRQTTEMCIKWLKDASLVWKSGDKMEISVSTLLEALKEELKTPEDRTIVAAFLNAIFSGNGLDTAIEQLKQMCRDININVTFIGENHGEMYTDNAKKVSPNEK